MTRRRLILPILVLAALTGRASAAQVTLTNQWQNLGNGPLLISVLNGDGMFEASATTPTDSGLPIFRNQQPFAFNATLPIWGRSRSSSSTPTVTYTPIVVGGSSGGGSVTQGTSPWVDNVAQFGGTNVVTGTGASGAGIPRFTFSNDSAIANTAFGISGTLPAFAQTPTFNLGTLNGAATSANQTNVQSAAGTAAGTLIGVQGGGTTAAPVNTNAQQLAGTALGAPTATGTAPAAGTIVPNTNTSVTASVLPAGAATAANQNVTTAGTSATNAQAIQGVTNGVPIPTVSAGGTVTVTGSLGPGVNNTGAQLGVYSYVSTDQFTGGVASFSRIPSVAANNNLTQAKSSAGRVYKIVACNTTTTPYRIKFYNAASANVTVGTTTPMFTRPLPAAASSGGLNCASYDMADIGWYFGTAISYAFTANAADSDTTAPAAGAITDVSVEYQ